MHLRYWTRFLVFILLYYQQFDKYKSLCACYYMYYIYKLWWNQCKKELLVTPKN